MLILGVASVPFCWELQRDRFVPRRLAVWGIVGYTALAAGASLELIGLSAGLVLTVPGGLFEVALGLTLIARGLPDQVHHAVAVLAAWCRGLYASIFAVAISHLLTAVHLLGDGQHHGRTDPRVEGGVLAEIQQFDDIWSLGLGLFGVHLLLIS